MKKHSDKSSSDHKSALNNSSIQKKSKGSNKIQDNSAEAIQMRQLQAGIDNSAEVQQFQSYKENIQLQTDEQTPVQFLGWEDILETGQEMADQILGDGTSEMIINAVDPTNGMSLSERTNLVLMASANATMANITTVMTALGADETLMDNVDEAMSIDEFNQENAQMKTIQLQENDAATEGTETKKPQDNNTGLPDELKAGIEKLSGLSMDNVKVHYNSSKPAELNALAYAQGTDIHIGPGQEKHLAHEAWHVVQQKEGRVATTTQMKGGVNINDDAGLEKEADVMGAKALEKDTDQGVLSKKSKENTNSTKQLKEGEQMGAKALSNASKNNENPVKETSTGTNETVQRVLNIGEQGPLRVRALALEARITAAEARLPGIITTVEHPLLEPVRAAFALVRADFGVDDSAAITQSLDEAEVSIVAFETCVNTHYDAIQAVGTAYDAFAGDDLSSLDQDLASLSADILGSSVTTTTIDNFKRSLDRQVIFSNKQMQALRSQNAQLAIERLEQYIDGGYVAINPLNSFYESEFDYGKDKFGAAASVYSTADSGKMQWLREWEFHIHGEVVRDDNDDITGFTISRGHIKPSKNAKALGVSIIINNQAMLNQVIADSQAKVTRWGGSKKGKQILSKTN